MSTTPLAATVRYRTDVRPAARMIAALYREAQLRRPVDDVDRIARMYEGSTLVITAWKGDTLVGILRGWTDGAYDGYVCDLAVAPRLQRVGIGRALLEQAHDLYPDVQFVLRASIIAADYYRHLGWKPIENGWFFPRPEWQ
jgi:ribosomal protein S18 acetylase RimI-like enzyme